MRQVILAAGLALAAASAAEAQMAAGGMFQVNSFVPDEQLRGRPAVGPKGDFIVVWNSLEQDGSGYGVVAQRFDALGNRLGGEFFVNSQAAGNQYMTGVAADADGNYIVTWTNDVGNPDPSRDVFARFIDRSGAARSDDFRVNAFVLGRQSAPAVAPLPGGGAVFVWESAGQDGSDVAVIGRVFDGRGNPLTGEFLVNTFTVGLQGAPRVSSDAAGNFVVVWHSQNQDGSGRAVIGRRFNAVGSALSAEFLVNTYTPNFQQYPSVSAVADGRFVVVWESGNTLGGPTQDGNNYGVFGRTFDAVGNPASGEFQINVYTIDHQRESDVVNYGNNSFLAAWHSQDQPPSGFQNRDVYARQYRFGVPGPEFLVNSSNTAGQQFLPALAADEAGGNIVAVWTNHPTIGFPAPYDVFAQRYGGLMPYSMAADASPTASSNGNRVVENGETVIVQPAWWNVNGLPLSFSGQASAFFGPAGPSYQLLDNAAGYGPTPHNTVKSCGAVSPGCYAMRVSGTRPAAHWDAQFREDIAPAELGQSKVWSVHVGDSFGDVSRLNAFYRFVETAYHHGVMDGCAPNNFCVASPVRRDEMAFHVMKSREPNYVPPACTPGLEMFNDVPAASIYCRWVEELARRGVVAGCGGGSYCPASGVTREQLAVYLLRTLDPALVPPPCGVPAFVDVPPSSPFCPWVEELKRRGVVTGCTPVMYCPAHNVDRGQMSVFLSVTFGLNLYGP